MVMNNTMLMVYGEGNVLFVKMQVQGMTTKRNSQQSGKPNLLARMQVYQQDLSRFWISGHPVLFR